MYQKNIIAGPWDISLLRLREKVTFVTRLVAPVSEDNIRCLKKADKHFQICLGVDLEDKDWDTDIDAFVYGFGTFGSVTTKSGRIDCWTDDTGPSKFQQ